jgi:5-formyltetrahydrofolate cyclo-ligase
MSQDKIFLRNKFILKRDKKYLTSKKFNYKLISNLIKKHFNKKKITIAAYYPANHEVNILKFLETISKKKIKIALPVIGMSEDMRFKLWDFKEPLFINKFGILEPKKTNKEIVPDLIMVPLVSFDSKLNRIGYGKGYYDRKLKKIKKIKKNIIALGIAYSFQKCRRVPINKHDYKLDYIFTEQGIISSK